MPMFKVIVNRIIEETVEVIVEARHASAAADIIRSGDYSRAFETVQDSDEREEVELVRPMS